MFLSRFAFTTQDKDLINPGPRRARTDVGQLVSALRHFHINWPVSTVAARQPRRLEHNYGICYRLRQDVYRVPCDALSILGLSFPNGSPDRRKEVKRQKTMAATWLSLFKRTRRRVRRKRATSAWQMLITNNVAVCAPPPESLARYRGNYQETSWSFRPTYLPRLHIFLFGWALPYS